jgi:hypothetical protein
MSSFSYVVGRKSKALEPAPRFKAASWFNQDASAMMAGDFAPPATDHGTCVTAIDHGQGVTAATRALIAAATHGSATTGSAQAVAHHIYQAVESLCEILH